jgi:multiple sugar transport system substrate-binding protein
MKKILILFIALFLSITLVACGDETDEPVNPDDPVTLTFFGWGSKEEQENFQILVNEFMTENPNIDVVYSGTDSSNYMNTLKNKGKNLPDVFYIPDYEFMQWADSGKLLALDDYISQEELDSMWELSTEMYRYNRDEYKLGEGDLFGLPKDLGPYGIVYNKDLLQAIITSKGLSIGLPDPNVPMTWEQFVAYLQEITGTYDGKNIYGIGYYELMAAVYSNNADFFDASVKNQTITHKNFIDAVQFVADLSLKYGVAPSADEQSSQNAFQRFLNQGCVFTFMGPWDCKQFWNDLPFEFDLVPTPVGPAEGAKSTSWVGSVAYCVSANTKKKDAAIKLVKFLACSEKSNKMNYQ